MEDEKGRFNQQTCKKNTPYDQIIWTNIVKKGGIFIDGWGCQGASNYFPLSLFGGLHTNKPDKDDIKNATEFLLKLIKES